MSSKLSVFFPELILLKSLYVPSVSEWDLNIYLCSNSAQSSNNPFLDIDQDANLLSMCLITKINNDFKLTRIQQKFHLQRSVSISQRILTLQWQPTSPSSKTRLALRWGRLLKSCRKIWTDGGLSCKF